MPKGIVPYFLVSVVFRWLNSFASPNHENYRRFETAPGLLSQLRSQTRFHYPLWTLHELPCWSASQAETLIKGLVDPWELRWTALTLSVCIGVIDRQVPLDMVLRKPSLNLRPLLLRNLTLLLDQGRSVTVIVCPSRGITWYQCSTLGSEGMTIRIIWAIPIQDSVAEISGFCEWLSA